MQIATIILATLLTLAQSSEFRPHGYYFLEHPPSAFTDIDSIQHWSSDETGPDSSTRLRGVNLVDGKRYRFRVVQVDRTRFVFATERVGGVHYRFTGRYLRTDFRNDRLDEEKAVVAGVITKYRKGVRVASARVRLSYFAGT